jgi:predicted PurR-regulated permease PerM
MVQPLKKLQKVEITSKNIIHLFLLGIGFIVLWTLRNLILTFFISFLLMEVLNPVINQLEKLKIPRPLSTVAVCLLVIMAISLSISQIIPIFVEQTSGLVKALPVSLQNIKVLGISAIDFSSQFRIIESIPSEIAKTILSLFSHLFDVLLTLVITFFLLQERQSVKQYVKKHVGGKSNRLVLRLMNLLENRLTKWVKGEFILMIIIGLMSYIAYLILGLKYAVPLAIMAGVLEVIPNIGPIVATSVATLIALTISPFIAIMTIISGFVIQQLENNFIVPKVMKETTGLHPLITIIVIVVGAKLAGISGAALGIPIFITLQIIIEFFYERKVKNQ